jgi:parallel beta-helix repeat protein
VGNRDGVIVDNWVEGAVDGIFMEISRGMTIAGNVLVRCNKGVRILNSADARIYNNTFVDTPASIERNGRIATGDRFGWHASTGPGLDQREGHVFVNNLLVASAAYRGPLLMVDQPAAFCEKHLPPQTKEMSSNVYVRAVSADSLPLVQWSPGATEDCVEKYPWLEYHSKQSPNSEFGKWGLDRTPASVFRAPDLDRYDLLEPLPAGEAIPDDVRKLLGWSEEEARTVGAYPRGR